LCIAEAALWLTLGPSTVIGGRLIYATQGFFRDGAEAPTIPGLKAAAKIAQAHAGGRKDRGVIGLDASSFA
jgi:hypothetical protein